MASVAKHAGRKYYLAWFRGEKGKRINRSTGTTDKRRAMQLALQWEKEADDIYRGLVDPRKQRRANQTWRSIEEHLPEWEESMRQRGRTEKHIQDLVLQVRRVIEYGKIDTAANLLPSRIDAAMAVYREQGLSMRMRNKAKTATKTFTNWLVADGRLAVNELGSVSTQSVRSDRRLKRRALSKAEAAKLIAATEASTVNRFNMTPRDRAMLYRFALGTGLRANEIASITPDAIVFEVAQPHVDLEAKVEKNRKGTKQPLPAHLVRDLAAWMLGRPADRPMFAFNRYALATGLFADLKAAGIEPTNKAGERVDFHALRHTFITWLATSGVPLVTAQRLARHSSPTITADYYVHLDVEDLGEALNRSLAAPDAERRKKA